MTILSKIIKNLKDNPELYFERTSTPEIVVKKLVSHMNSEIAHLSVREDSESKNLFVKLLYPDMADGRSNRSDREYKEEQIKTEYDLLKKLYQAFSSYPDLGVVKPVACFPELFALISEGQEGIKLSSFMGKAKIYSGKNEMNNLMHWINLCGKWLRLFQRFIQDDSARWYDFNEVFDYCDVRLDRLTHQRPQEFTDGFCKGLRCFLSEQVEQLKESEIQIVGRHNDYGPGNMIISNQKLVLLDFSGFNYGPACCDYVKFWSELDLMKTNPLILSRTVEKLQGAFVSGYGRRIDSQEPLFNVFRVAYILDKMDDVWLDWSTMPWIRRQSYKRLYFDFFARLKGYCQL